MATHSSVLAWRIPWTEEPGGLQSKGSESQTWLSNSTHTWRYETWGACVSGFLQSCLSQPHREAREGGRRASAPFGKCWFTPHALLHSATVWSTFWLLVKEGCSSERGMLIILCWDLGAQTPGGGVNPPVQSWALGDGGDLQAGQAFIWALSVLTLEMHARTLEHRRNYVESSIFNREVAFHAVRDQTGNKRAGQWVVCTQTRVSQGWDWWLESKCQQGHRAPSAQPGPRCRRQTRAQGGQGGGNPSSFRRGWKSWF